MSQEENNFLDEFVKEFPSNKKKSKSLEEAFDKAFDNMKESYFPTKDPEPYYKEEGEIDENPWI